MAACHQCGSEAPGQARFCPACGASLQAPFAADHEMRKVVTVVFCDLVRSTPLSERLDPETFGGIVNQYHEIADALLREHGGSVQKFGDAVVAFFGVPTLHEDDALRAVTAAIKLGPAISELNEQLERLDVRLGLRIGVNTGEVLVRESPDGQPQVLGEAVNVAARLEQTAEPREILIGDQTYQLVRDVVIAEPLDALSLRGKTAPVDAWRLLAVDAEVRDHTRRTNAPLVGRLPDLALLEAAFERVVAERRCHLVTVLGEAGVGKTRLVNEFTSRLGDRATVRKGRCRSYGEGITYWPVARMIRQSLAKEARAELHQRYANWLERTTPGHQAAIDEMIGFHLEAAHRLRVELNHPDSATRELAMMAGERLAAAGHALAVRGDVPDTAADLLERAVALLPDGHERRIDTLLDLAGALRDAEHFAEALEVFQQASEAADATGDRRRAAHATLGRLDLVWFTRPSALADGGGSAIEAATRVLENANDDLGLAKALRLSPPTSRSPRAVRTRPEGPRSAPSGSPATWVTSASRRSSSACTASSSSGGRRHWTRSWPSRSGPLPGLVSAACGWSRLPPSARWHGSPPCAATSSRHGRSTGTRAASPPSSSTA